MGLFGIGGSREEKMAWFILRKIQKHIANMIKRSDAFYSAIRRHPDKRAMIEDATGAAFIAYFITYLCFLFPENAADLTFDILFHMNSNLRQLIEDCAKYEFDETEYQQYDANDIVKIKCASWLSCRIGLLMDFHASDYSSWREQSFMHECVFVASDVIAFKDKFIG